MGRWTVGLTMMALGVLTATSPASAQEDRRELRVLGEAVSPPPPGMPARFVIDATLSSGDDPFKAEMEGWFASLDDNPQGDGLDGACVEARCAFSVEFGEGKLAISADLAGKGPPGTGRMVLTDENGKALGEVPVRFTAIAGPVEGLGEIAPADAIGSKALAELLMWNGANVGFSNASDGPVGSFDRSSVADWQAFAGRPGAGLILVEDLALLRAHAAELKARVGWTPISGSGWSAGYPAVLMPVAETVGGERRFASADGKLRLVIAVEPPMSDEAWEAFIDKVTADQPGIDRHGYVRVNDDMEINWTEHDRDVVGEWRRREDGLVRLEFSAPHSEEPADPDLALIIPRSLMTHDD